MMLSLFQKQAASPLAGKSKLVLVQALRALAALAVVFLHAQFDAVYFARQRDFIPNRTIPWEVGVDIFFVISGFIIVHASKNLFGKEGSRLEFLARRLIRIVPLYWLATLVFLSVSLLIPWALNSPSPTVPEITASFLFFPFINSSGAAQPVLTLGWTLNYEMAFYLVFALAIVWSRARAISIVACVFCTLVAVGTISPLSMPFSFWANTIVLEFVMGMGIALAQDSGGRPGLILRAVLVYIAIAMLRENLIADDIDRLFALGVPSAMLVMAAVLGSELRFPVFIERMLVLLGDASYALYLFHPIALRTIRLLLKEAEVSPSTYIVLAIAGAVALSVFIHLIIEKPMMRYLRTCWDERKL